MSLFSGVVEIGNHLHEDGQITLGRATGLRVQQERLAHTTERPGRSRSVELGVGQAGTRVEQTPVCPQVIPKAIGKPCPGSHGDNLLHKRHQHGAANRAACPLILAATTTSPGWRLPSSICRSQREELSDFCCFSTSQNLTIWQTAKCVS